MDTKWVLEMEILHPVKGAVRRIPEIGAEFRLVERPGATSLLLEREFGLPPEKALNLTQIWKNLGLQSILSRR